MKNPLTEANRFEALFQYASMGILVADSEGIIRMANNFLMKQFGYADAEELIGMKIEILVPFRHHNVHEGHRNNYNKHPKPRTMGQGLDLHGLKKDGQEFPVEISLSNFTGSDGKYTIAFVRDISKRKEIEQSVIQQKQEIEELNNDLEQKVQLRTLELQESKDELSKALNKEKELGDLKSRFVSMASHEFRTPLSTILSSASLLAKYTLEEEQEKRDKHIQRIKSSVNDLTDILNEFLSIGKMEDGKIATNYTSFDIKEFIENICGEIQGIVKKGQQIKYSNEGTTKVWLDSTLLKNILINLLSNAIKFSPENAVVYVSSKVDDDNIEIAVTDAGIGISAEDQVHLFERFFRGKNVTNIQGTGLGLHIVGKYAELMDGQTTFLSELEKGTTFTLTFNNKKER